MNFTDAQFYAGFFTGLGLLVGAFWAWRLDVRKSPWRGFSISYGTNLWPWVFASQISSMLLVIYFLNYTHLFSSGEYGWLPTFITVVGGPPAIMLIYGPSWITLITSVLLGSLIAFPIAFWFMTKVVTIFEIPVVGGNVLTMAVLGILMCQIFKVLPWIEKKPLPSIENGSSPLSKEERFAEMSRPSWFLRRVLADFSEAQFYGNEIAAVFLLIGVIIDFLFNHGYPGYGSGLLPAILLSQIVGSATGIFLYFDKYVEQGWYPTFVPVVSAGPTCVLAYGGTLPVALFAGILGGHNRSTHC